MCPGDGTRAPRLLGKCPPLSYLPSSPGVVYAQGFLVHTRAVWILSYTQKEATERATREDVVRFPDVQAVEQKELSGRLCRVGPEVHAVFQSFASGLDFLSLPVPALTWGTWSLHLSQWLATSPRDRCIDSGSWVNCILGLTLPAAVLTSPTAPTGSTASWLPKDSPSPATSLPTMAQRVVAQGAEMNPSAALWVPPRPCEPR